MVNIQKVYLRISVAISIMSISATLFINYSIAKEYKRVDGKTRLLFGIKELLQFGYQYYVLIFGLASFILATISKKDNTKGNKRRAAILLSLLAISIIFLRIWRLFVQSNSIQLKLFEVNGIPALSHLQIIRFKLAFDNKNVQGYIGKGAYQ